MARRTPSTACSASARPSAAVSLSRVGLARSAKDLAGSLEDRGHRGLRSVVGYAGCPVAKGPRQLVDELRVVRVGLDEFLAELRRLVEPEARLASAAGVMEYQAKAIAGRCELHSESLDRWIGLYQGFQYGQSPVRTAPSCS